MSLRDNDLLCQTLNILPDIGTGRSFLVRAQEFVRFQNPSVNSTQLAAALCTSERTLQRRLKALSQETPKEFITRIRIEMACTMLIGTNVSIRQVAFDCGYSEDTAFRKAFNQIIDCHRHNTGSGCSPACRDVKINAEETWDDPD